MRTPEIDAAAVEEFLKWLKDGSDLHFSQKDNIAQWLASRQPAESKDRRILNRREADRKPSPGDALWHAHFGGFNAKPVPPPVVVSGEGAESGLSGMAPEPRPFAVGDVVEAGCDLHMPNNVFVRKGGRGKVIGVAGDEFLVEIRRGEYAVEIVTSPRMFFEAVPGPFPKNAAGEEEWWR